MILSGPIVTSPASSRTSPLRRPAAIVSASPTAYVAVRTRSTARPESERSIHSVALSAHSISRTPTTPRRTAASRTFAYAVRLPSAVCVTSSSRAKTGNHSFSSTTASRGGTPRRRRAAELSQPWWASPLMRTTGMSPLTASSSATVGWRSHAGGAVAEALDDRARGSTATARRSRRRRAGPHPRGSWSTTGRAAWRSRPIDPGGRAGPRGPGTSQRPSASSTSSSAWGAASERPRRPGRRRCAGRPHRRAPAAADGDDAGPDGCNSELTRPILGAPGWGWHAGPSARMCR